MKKATTQFKFIPLLLAVVLLGFSCQKKAPESKTSVAEEYAKHYAELENEVTPLLNSPEALRSTGDNSYLMGLNPSDYVDTEGNLKKEPLIAALVEKGADAELAEKSVSLLEEYLDKIEKVEFDQLRTVMPKLLEEMATKEPTGTLKPGLFKVAAVQEFVLVEAILKTSKNNPSLEEALKDCEITRNRRTRTLNIKTGIGGLLGVLGTIASGPFAGATAAVAATTVLSHHAIELQDISQEYHDCVRKANRDHGNNK